MIPSKQLFLDVEQHLLEDKQPSKALNSIFQKTPYKEFKPLVSMKFTKQSPIYHPEGNVWNHTMLVVDEAAKLQNQSKNPHAFMWAALLHDIGKPDTTQICKEKITSYNHEKVGAELTRQFLSAFITNHKFIDEVYVLVRYHMQILFVVKNLPFADMHGMRANADIEEIALLGLCDRLGRLHADRLKEKETIRLFLEKCRNL